MNKKRTRLAMGLVTLMLLLTACGQSQAQGASVELLVAAAASLKNVYDQGLIPAFEAQQEGVTVSGTYDSSGKLQLQIEEGLDADLFMSAAVTQMDTLVEEGFVPSEGVVDLLENKIVLIVPTGNPANITSFEDIETASAIAIGDPGSVPAGQYAQEVLTSLGLWEDVVDRASLGTNVTEVLNQVAAASADVGIVYATDAASMASVEVVAEAPEGSLAEPVIYPVAVLTGSNHPEEAQAFLDFLQSEEAQAIFEDYGFTVVG